MCILFWTVNNHAKYKFIFAGNRDEFLKRPTAKADYWKEPYDHILGGVDLQQTENHSENGTWLGITKQGRFSALTNYRELNFKGELSRGKLVRDFLYGSQSVHDYFESLQKDKFGGFSLINFDFGKQDVEMAYLTNRENQPIIDLKDGEIYGLSNSILDNPWAKVNAGKEIFSKIIKETETEQELINALLGLLSITEPMNNENDLTQILNDLRERIYIPLFNFPKSLGKYGTRTSSIVLIDYQDNVTFIEHDWQNNENHVAFNFKIHAASDK